ncbi:hypothetical protein K502DRAFT_333510 [Neoconidiobolus thromboides FSU 785]|nr:hypothetical protein K502DRAFT_333510 [Neoconidiobolus thromboides FSU 785]
MQYSFKKALTKVQSICQSEKEELKLQLGNKLQFVRPKNRATKPKFIENRHSGYEYYKIDFKCDYNFDVDFELKGTKNKRSIVPIDHMLISKIPEILDLMSKF